MNADDINRKRGDTYPIEVVLTRDGGWSLKNSTVTMRVEFEDGIIHELNGTIKDVYKKIVSFVPIAALTDTVRIGSYDIEVDDTRFIATHMEGIYTVEDDIS